VPLSSWMVTPCQAGWSYHTVSACVLHLFLCPAESRSSLEGALNQRTCLNLIKKLKLPALRNKAPAPEDLPRQGEGDQTGAQDPATKRAVPIDQYSDLSCGEEARSCHRGPSQQFGWALCYITPKAVQQLQQQHLAAVT